MNTEKESRPLWRTALYVLLIIVGLLIYAYGWQVTDINLEVPQDEERQKLVGRALRGLLSPDLFERDEQSQSAYAHFLAPCSGAPPAQPEVAEGQPRVEVSPECGEPRDKITIEASNFRPYSDGYVRWTPPGGNSRSLGKIKTDGEGNFTSSQLKVPSVSESEEPQTIEVEVVWPVGMPRPSEALKVTFERMIETIFLALMATTLAIVVAVPISFIAAYNLMRQIRKPLGGFLAALLPLPLGWVLGRRAFRPVSDLALDIGGNLWLSLLFLAAIGLGLYFVLIKRTPRQGRRRNPWLAGLLRYVRMILTLILLIFVCGLISGVGMQIGQAMSEGLVGILGGFLFTLASFLELLLPVFGGLAGMLVLGSLLGALQEALLDRVDNAFIQHSLGLTLGSLVGGLLLYLIYTGINNFYNPGEPSPFTLAFTIGGAVLGGVLGLVLRADYPLPVGVIVYYITRTILNALRSIEPLIMAIVFAIWVSIGPFAGVLALTLHSIAALGKLYSEQVESIDPGPVEAITSTGATRLQTIVYGVIPQIVPPYIAFTLYRWDINVRMSTIIGFVGGGGIGFILSQWINLLQYRQAGVAVLAIAIVVAALDYVSAQARERIG